MLAFYLAHLPGARRPGGRRPRRRPVSPRLFYLAELVLSPLFGILSDRYGHHRVMLFGPVFGAVAVDPDRAAFLYRRRPSCWSSAGRGSSRARRAPRACPSILGFIAIGDRRQRGPARQDVGPVRGGDAGRPRRSAPSSASSSSMLVGPAGVLPQRRALRRLVPDLPLRRQDPRRRGRARSPASTSDVEPLPGPDPDARTSGSWPRPGSRSTRRSACG